VAAALANRVLKKTDRIDDLPDARRPEPAGRDLLPSQRAHEHKPTKQENGPTAYRD